MREVTCWELHADLLQNWISHAAHHSDLRFANAEIFNRYTISRTWNFCCRSFCPWRDNCARAPCDSYNSAIVKSLLEWGYFVQTTIALCYKNDHKGIRSKFKWQRLLSKDRITCKNFEQIYTTPNGVKIMTGCLQVYTDQQMPGNFYSNTNTFTACSRSLNYSPGHALRT